MKPKLLLVAALALLAFPATAAAEDYDAPDPTPIAPPGPPTSPPSISGSAQIGGTLTGFRGTWPLTPSVTGRWLRCSVAASRCDATGDTDLTYNVTAADAGFVIKLRVVGRSVLGGTRTVDAQTATIPGPVVQLSAPRNATPPTIQGALRDGQLLAATQGTWVGTEPISYSYAWAVCATGAGCQAAGTGPTYRIKSADTGKRVLLAVTARNAVGAAAAFVQSGVITGPTAGLKRISPFPTLLIDGRVSGATTSISTLRLRRVPGGSTIGQSCKGRGCPFRRATTKVRKGKSRSVALRRLQRRMRAGTTVVITVRKGNTLGKYIRLRFRRSSAPARVDRCVAPKSSKPFKCP